MVRFTTIKQAAEAEETIEKSKFIAHIRRADTREEAESFIVEIKHNYKDATHNVPAFVIGEKQEIQWASDDGEPSGTSGAPMLQMIVKEGLTNIVIVVTRYFGGIKLGTGGLVRAYTGIARKVLEYAGRNEVRDIKSLNIKVSYSILSKIQQTAAKTNFYISSISYEDEPVITVSFESEFEESILKRLSDLTMGNYVII